MGMQWIKVGLAALVITASNFAFGANDTALAGLELTPPRLSFIEGNASFWRPGAEDWAPARINTPLAAGDTLYTGERANIEIQVGPRAFARAQENTQFGLVNLEPDFVQFSLNAGQASLDLRSLPASHTVELDTPNAIFTIEHPGYYRAVVENGVTRFTTRRGGRATVTVAGRPQQTISPSEEVVVSGSGAPVVVTYVAPPLDAWDRWNYARTDHEIEALSGRYVSQGVYGVGALDDWGTWRVVPTYGSVWVPDRVAPGWTPYSTGSWVWHPYYGWTWVDDAPWGWAPFHYGRWVFIGGYWAWAPGPIIVRPIYAPALVAFFGVGLDVSVRIGIGLPAIGWVVLGWGEPLLPWWGPPGFIGRPWWSGWGGPRVVNNTVIARTTIVNVNTIVYEHTKTPRALVAVAEKQFGSGPIRGIPFSPAHPREIQHIRDAHPVRPGPGSLVPVKGDTIRPPAAVASRSVVATRPPRETSLPWPPAPGVKPRTAAPAPRVIAPPKRPEADAALTRPSFGEKGTERPRPPGPPRLEDLRRESPTAAERVPQRSAPATIPPAATRPAPRATPPATVEKAPQRGVPPTAAPPAVVQPVPRAAPPAASTPPAQSRPAPHTAPPARALPGRPANELSPRQPGGGSQSHSPGKSGER